MVDDLLLLAPERVIAEDAAQHFQGLAHLEAGFGGGHRVILGSGAVGLDDRPSAEGASGLSVNHAPSKSLRFVPSHAWPLRSTAKFRGRPTLLPHSPALPGGASAGDNPQAGAGRRAASLRGAGPGRNAGGHGGPRGRIWAGPHLPR